MYIVRLCASSIPRPSPPPPAHLEVRGPRMEHDVGRGVLEIAAPMVPLAGFQLVAPVHLQLLLLFPVRLLLLQTLLQRLLQQIANVVDRLHFLRAHEGRRDNGGFCLSL